MKPLKKVAIKWSPGFAYAIGLIVTDGSLSKDGRHIIFTSKNKELAVLFNKYLGIHVRIGRKARAREKIKRYHYIQFSDIHFYKFLQQIGLTPNKSKTIGKLSIPGKYFFDFLRGHFDGDGTCYSYWDKRWKSSFMFYTAFVSASFNHIQWLRMKIYEFLWIHGHITQDGHKHVYQLKYAKRDSLKLIRSIYPSRDIPNLSRKRLKIERILRINDKANIE